MLDRPIVILCHRQLNLSSDTRCEISRVMLRTIVLEIRERERERERKRERERNWESITNKYLERDATSLVFHFGRKNVLAGIFAV